MNIKSIPEKIDALKTNGTFLGGPEHLFEEAGRRTLMTLLSEGLLPTSKVLDIGCGCMRCGFWLVQFLEEGAYFGIEPNARMLESGIKVMLGPELVSVKRPAFSYSDKFDFHTFGEKFDFFLARSIWTHASKVQISLMLDIPATTSTSDYSGDVWVGRSHESEQAGVVHHAAEWIAQSCTSRGLRIRPIEDPLLSFGNQAWLCIE
jgi:SAM-dependent methyltransferase